jgi:protein-L-isoaspartate(D-aspartate) O-methyltransferase
MDFTAARASLMAKLGSEIRDKRVLSAMGRVPRELFVPSASRSLAYEDSPLPIGHGQTISQPYIVALMTEALGLTGGEKVLEIGTGSGYQAAILAELASLVISTERIPALAESAKKVLAALGYKNIIINVSASELGWPQEAPYDAIIVTAGAPAVPPELVDQLAIGGRLVIPVGPVYVQQLCKLTRQSQRNSLEDLGGCRFVPLIGRGAWKRDNF